MRRATKWRPWQFSLRFLLSLTAIVALFLGWWVRRVEPQRRAVAKIRQLGGTLEFEARGPLRLLHGCGGECFQEVVQVELSRHLAEDATPALAEFRSLEKVRLLYDEGFVPMRTRRINGQAIVTAYDDGPSADYLRRRFPNIDVELCDVTPGLLD